MFFFKCTITNGNGSTLSEGGFESLDLCRKFGLKETTNSLMLATWNDDSVVVEIDESLARQTGRFQKHHTSSLEIPIFLLKKGDLEVVSAHNKGTIRLNHDLSQDRLKEIIMATLLDETVKLV